VFAAASVAGPCYCIARIKPAEVFASRLAFRIILQITSGMVEIGMHDNNFPEPWLRGTLPDVPAVPRAVLHALQLAREDVERWCGSLSDEELNAHPAGLPSVAFQIRHMTRSIDRLLTYAEGNLLSERQILALKSEDQPAIRNDLFTEFANVLERAAGRIRSFRLSELEEKRSVGKKQLPTTLAGLLVHIAEHTQRHSGQAVTTAKAVRSMRVSNE
jgi:uncharacterized damage-inducible protein DinB